MENGRLGCFAGETMENTVKLCKTIQNHGKLEKGVWVFLFITTIKKKKIKKQLLVADGGIIENKVLFSYVWLLGVICGYVWFLLFWCAFLWVWDCCFGRCFGFGRGGKGALRLSS